MISPVHKTSFLASHRKHCHSLQQVPVHPADCHRKPSARPPWSPYGAWEVQVRAVPALISQAIGCSWRFCRWGKRSPLWGICSVDCLRFHCRFHREKFPRARFRHFLAAPWCYETIWNSLRRVVKVNVTNIVEKYSEFLSRQLKCYQLTAFWSDEIPIRNFGFLGRPVSCAQFCPASLNI